MVFSEHFNCQLKHRGCSPKNLREKRENLVVEIASTSEVVSGKVNFPIGVRATKLTRMDI